VYIHIQEKFLCRKDLGKLEFSIFYGGGPGYPIIKDPLIRHSVVTESLTSEKESIINLAMRGAAGKYFKGIKVRSRNRINIRCSAANGGKSRDCFLDMSPLDPEFQLYRSTFGHEALMCQ
jgi:hypothetical protein